MIFQSHTINLVGTRCTDGQHWALQRWYADHVHLLLMAPELHKAQLFRSQQTLMGQPPEYFCVYEFASHDDFLQFEHGPPKAQATALTNAAAGRNSIEIVQRTQYARWLHRQWLSLQNHSLPTWRLAACLTSDADWALDAQRWLADQLQDLRTCCDLRTAQVYAQHDQAHQAFLMLEIASHEVSEVWQHLMNSMSQPGLYGLAPRLKVQWAVSAIEVQAWLR
jgi:hypothetical protein